MAPLGFVAVLAGWTTTEVGRQPWTVYGLLRTADSVTPSLTGGDVLLSLLGYMAVYLVIFPAGILFMASVVRQGPAPAPMPLPDRERPARSATRSRSSRKEARHERRVDFVPLWTLILGRAVFFYVLLDGFDLGVGILYGFLPDEGIAQHRR